MNRSNPDGRRPISRREFVKGLTAVAAGALGSARSAPSGENQGMKIVTLGRTGMRTPQFLGDWMGERDMYDIALKAGVNYWHKIGTWRNPAPYELFRGLDRDSFYCDTIINSIDKERAIQLFEKNLASTGLKMIDGFKIHSMYKSAEDVKTKMGGVQAFEELKRQGKTRFLMLSQHINTAEVFEAAVESDLFDLIQIPINPTVPQDYFTKEEFPKTIGQEQYFRTIKKAADRGIAVVAQKVFLGGTKTWDEIQGLRDKVKDYLPDDKSIATALIHWTLAVPGVAAFGNLLFTRNQLIENLKAVGGKLTDTEDKGIERFAQAIGPHVCRMCGACLRTVPGALAVSEILRFKSYHTQGMPGMARTLYANLPESEKPQPGQDLSAYDRACRYGLPLAALLRNAERLLA